MCVKNGPTQAKKKHENGHGNNWIHLLLEFPFTLMFDLVTPKE